MPSANVSMSVQSSEYVDFEFFHSSVIYEGIYLYLYITLYQKLNSK